MSTRRQALKTVATAILAAQAMAGVALAGDTGGKSRKSSDPVGQCYGVVGKEEGDCGGRDPSTGKSWSCAGQNPTADLGWKKLKKSECDATPKHAEATTRRFVPDPA